MLWLILDGDFSEIKETKDYYDLYLDCVPTAVIPLTDEILDNIKEYFDNKEDLGGKIK